jgi:malonyl-CoA/methylmalonyl-CoA synthetase
MFLLNRKVSLRRQFSLLANVCDPSRSHLVAVIDPDGSHYTYGDLHQASSHLARKILDCIPSKPTTIACYHSPGSSYVISSLAAWKLEATLVPLSPAHTQKELEYFLADSGAELVLSSTEPTLVKNIDTIPLLKLLVSKDLWLDRPHAEIFRTTNQSDGAALIIYTSGTTGKPKGVVHSHHSLFHMIQSLTEAWEYSQSDKILHFLPLHHLHGILNKCWCVLNAGGTVEFLKSANAVEIWKRLSDSSRLVNLFMAVPTIYAKMLAVQSRGDLPREIIDRAIENMKSMRVMVSGSASLPLPILRKWRDLSGHHLLERYGMTEVGMALSNPLVGERREGFVGSPLPFIECKIVPDSEFHLDDSATEGTCGELCLKVNISSVCPKIKPILGTDSLQAIPQSSSRYSKCI